MHRAPPTEPYVRFSHTALRDDRLLPPSPAGLRPQYFQRQFNLRRGVDGSPDLTKAVLQCYEPSFGKICVAKSSIHYWRVAQCPDRLSPIINTAPRRLPLDSKLDNPSSQIRLSSSCASPFAPCSVAMRIGPHRFCFRHHVSMGFLQPRNSDQVVVPFS